MTTERKFFKCASIFLLLLNIVLSEKTIIIYNDNSSANGTRIKSPKASDIHIPACRNNQYFDQQEGRCVGVAGGGKAVYINYAESCGSYILKPHCSNSKYYYICKKDKTILAECAKRQEFDNRFQKCTTSGSKNINSSTVQPSVEHLENISPMPCVKLGRFPIPSHCDLFYICKTNGHRLYPSVYRCQKNEKYDAEKETCISDTTGQCSLNATLSCIPSIVKNSTEFENPVNHDEKTDDLEGMEANISKRTTEHLEYNKTVIQSSTLEHQEFTELATEDHLTNATQVDTTKFSSRNLTTENITSQTDISKTETNNSFDKQEHVLITEATTYPTDSTSDVSDDIVSTTPRDEEIETIAPQAESDTVETQETFNSSAEIKKESAINYNYTESDIQSRSEDLQETTTEENSVTETDQTQFYSTTISDGSIADNNNPTTELFTSESTTNDKEQDIYTEPATTQSEMSSEPELSTESSIAQSTTESLPSSISAFTPLAYIRKQTKTASAVSLEETYKTEQNSSSIVTELQPENKMEQHNTDAQDDIVPAGKGILSQATSPETELPIALVLTEISEKLTRRLRDIIQLILKNLFFS